MAIAIKRRLSQLTATILYNGRVGADVLGTDMTWKNACIPGVNCGYCRYASIGCPWGLTQQTLARLCPALWHQGLGTFAAERAAFGTHHLRLAVPLWPGTGAAE